MHNCTGMPHPIYTFLGDIALPKTKRGRFHQFFGRRENRSTLTRSSGFYSKLRASQKIMRRIIMYNNY